jgi:inositol-phosphate transport system substrate-binding protein
MLVAFASLPYYNTQHAVGSAHTGITNGQASMPAYREAWYLGAATPLLARTTFIPNHPEFGRYNGILYKGLQEAVEFLEEEMSNELCDSLKVVDSLS